MIFFRKKQRILPGMDLAPECIRRVFSSAYVDLYERDSFSDRVYLGTISYVFHRVFRGEDANLTYTVLPEKFVKKYVKLGKTIYYYDGDRVKNILKRRKISGFSLLRYSTVTIEVREAGVKRYTDDIEDLIAGLRRYGLVFINKFFEADLSDVELEEYFKALYDRIVSGDGETQMQALAEMLLRLHSMGYLDRRGLRMYVDALRFITVYRVGVVLTVKVKLDTYYGYLYKIKRRGLIYMRMTHKRIKEIKFYVLPLKPLRTREEIFRYVSKTFIQNEILTSLNKIIIHSLMIPITVSIGYVVDEDTVYFFKIYFLMNGRKVLDIVDEYLSICRWRKIWYKVYVDKHEAYAVLLFFEPEEAPGQYMFMTLANPLYIPFDSEKSDEILTPLFNVVSYSLYGMRDTEEAYYEVEGLTNDQDSVSIEPEEGKERIGYIVRSGFDGEMSYRDLVERIISALGGFPSYSVLLRKLGLVSRYARTSVGEKRGGAGRTSPSDELVNKLKELGLI